MWQRTFEVLNFKSNLESSFIFKVLKFHILYGKGGFLMWLIGLYPFIFFPLNLFHYMSPFDFTKTTFI